MATSQDSYATQACMTGKPMINLVQGAWTIIPRINSDQLQAKVLQARPYCNGLTLHESTYTANTRHL